MLLESLRLPMLQWNEEIGPFAQWLAETVKPQNILEIGTGPGGTAELFGKIATGKVVTIDLIGGATSGMNEEGCRERNAQLEPRVRCLLGASLSRDVFLKVLSYLDGELLDLLFIDGDHSYDGVAGDFAQYSPLVRKGGFVAFHDINAWKYAMEGVRVPEYWKDLQAKFEDAQRLTFSVDGDWGGIGVVQL